MIKKPRLSESRIRTGRASMRMHPHLRAAVDFLASAERRTVSQWLEMTVLQRVESELENKFEPNGCLQLGQRGQFRYKLGHEPLQTKR
jgi:hypothetical protein